MVILNIQKKVLKGIEKISEKMENDSIGPDYGLPSNLIKLPCVHTNIIKTNVIKTFNSICKFLPTILLFLTYVCSQPIFLNSL